MATVIEELTIALGFDGQPVINNLNAVNNGIINIGRSVNHVNSTLKTMENVVGGVRNQMLLMLSAFTAGKGVKDFFTGTIDDLVKLKYQTENLATSTEKIIEYGLAAEKTGSSIDAMTQALGNANADIAKMRYEGGQGVAALSMPGGINWWSAQGADPTKLKNGKDWLMAQFDVIKRINEAKEVEGHPEILAGPAAAMILAQRLGIEGLFNTAKMGSKAFLELAENQKQYAIATKADADNAQLLDVQMKNLGDSFKATSVNILIDLFPAIKDVLAIFQEFASWVGEHKGEISDALTKWATLTTGFVKSLVENKGNIGQTLDEWSSKADNFSIKIGMVTVNLGKLLELFGAKGPFGGWFSENSDETLGGFASDLSDHISQKGFALDADGKKIQFSQKNISGWGTESGAKEKDFRRLAPEIMRFFMSRGWSKDQAAGITAQLWEESNFNTQAQGDRSKTGKATALGLGQWHPDRAKAFEKMFNKNVLDASMTEQLMFVDWELNNTEKSAGLLLRQSKGAFDAGKRGVFYERPQSYINGGDERDRLETARGNIAQMMAALPLAKSSGIGSPSTNTQSNAMHVGTVNVYPATGDIMSEIQKSITPSYYGQFNGAVK